MARIIRFNREPHSETQLLLPWYATGGLEPDERAAVEVHLRDCAECQAELHRERQLEQAVATLPFEVEEGWAQLRSRIEARQPNLAAAFGYRLKQAFTGGRQRWGFALQAGAVAAVLLLAFSALVRPQASPPARYQTLSAPTQPPAADAVLVFRPEARQSAVAAALAANGARIVDGPTTTNAYLVTLPADDRTAALARLRASPAVALAETLASDGGG